MVDLPQQDWSLYENYTRPANVAWIRGLTPQDRFALYEDLFRIIWSSRRDLESHHRVERWDWQQKVATRLRLVEAFEKLDQLYCERPSANDPC